MINSNLLQQGTDHMLESVHHELFCVSVNFDVYKNLHKLHKETTHSSS